MNEQKLKECPFCGSNARFVEAQHTHAGVDMVICNKCGCRMYTRDPAAWNSRPESGSVGSVVAEIPDYLKVAEGLQELSEHLLAQRGVKRTEKAEELWQSMKGEEAAVYSAFLAQAITPIIEAKVALLSTAHRGEGDKLIAELQGVLYRLGELWPHEWQARTDLAAAANHAAQYLESIGETVDRGTMPTPVQPNVYMTLQDQTLEQLKSEMTRQDIPIAGMSRASGMSETHVSSVLSGKTKLTLRTVERMARVLGLSIVLELRRPVSEG